MKILFLASANRDPKISPIIRSQGQSIADLGIDVEYFGIRGKNAFGYLKNIPKLRKVIREQQIEVIHAHYLFSGIVGVLTFSKIPTILSLMGSDLAGSKVRRILARIFSFFWKSLIVKSEQMSSWLNGACLVIPNGVDLNKFRQLDRSYACAKVGFVTSVINIVFFSNPKRPEKNYGLAVDVIDSIKGDSNINFSVVYNIDHSDIVYYLNACDILLLTSKWEGSPNIVKEAMACNTTVVATNVGDIPMLFANTEGYFTAEIEKESLRLALLKAINFKESGSIATGRNRIIELGFDSISIANRIIKIYKEALNENLSRH